MHHYCSICADKEILEIKHCSRCKVRLSESYIFCRGHIVYDKEKKEVVMLCTQCYVDYLVNKK